MTMTTFRQALAVYASCFGGLAALALVVLMLTGCGGGEDLDPSQPPPVISCTVTPRPAACI